MLVIPKMIENRVGMAPPQSNHIPRKTTFSHNSQDAQRHFPGARCGRPMGLTPVATKAALEGFTPEFIGSFGFGLRLGNVLVVTVFQPLAMLHEQEQTTSRQIAFQFFDIRRTTTSLCPANDGS